MKILENQTVAIVRMVNMLCSKEVLAEHVVAIGPQVLDRLQGGDWVVERILFHQ